MYWNYPPAMEKVKVSTKDKTPGNATGGDEFEWRPVLGGKSKGTRRKILLKEWNEYNTGDDVCRRWRAKNSAAHPQMRYFLQNLEGFGLKDVDKAGRVITKDGTPGGWDTEGDGMLELCALCN